MKEANTLRQEAKFLRNEAFWQEEGYEALELEADRKIQRAEWLETLERYGEIYDAFIAAETEHRRHRIRHIRVMRDAVNVEHLDAIEINRRLARYADQIAPDASWPTDEPMPNLGDLNQ